MAVVAFLLEAVSEDLTAEQFKVLFNHRNKWKETRTTETAGNNEAGIIETVLDYGAVNSLKESKDFIALYLRAIRNQFVPCGYSPQKRKAWKLSQRARQNQSCHCSSGRRQSKSHRDSEIYPWVQSRL